MEVRQDARDKERKPKKGESSTATVPDSTPAATDFAIVHEAEVGKTADGYLVSSKAESFVSKNSINPSRIAPPSSSAISPSVLARATLAWSSATEPTTNHSSKLAA